MRGRPAGLLLTLVLALAACAAPTGADVASPVGAVAGANPAGVYGGNVTAVRATGPRTFTVTMTPLNADQQCSSEPLADVVEQLPEGVYVTTTYRVSSPVCPSPTLETGFTLAADLAGRPVVVDQQTWVLEPDGATTGALRRCDPTVGCDPQPAGCDDESYRLALDAGDFPRNGRTWEARACEVPWLVLDVDTTASGCAATGDDPAENPCLSGPRRVTRWVFTQRGPLWDTVATLPLTGGCGPRPPAGLTRALCEDLPAG